MIFLLLQQKPLVISKRLEASQILRNLKRSMCLHQQSTCYLCQMQVGHLQVLLYFYLSSMSYCFIFLSDWIIADVFFQGHLAYIIRIFFLLKRFYSVDCKPLDICMIFGSWQVDGSCTLDLLLLNIFDDSTLISGRDELPSDLVDLLVQTNLYDTAFTVVLKFWKDISLKRFSLTYFIVFDYDILKFIGKFELLIPSFSGSLNGFFKVCP